MISRDDLSPEDRAIYDATFVGAADRLDREVQALKLAVINALPYTLRRIVQWLMEVRS